MGGGVWNTIYETTVLHLFHYSGKFVYGTCLTLCVVVRRPAAVDTMNWEEIYAFFIVNMVLYVIIGFMFPHRCNISFVFQINSSAFYGW
jgi:hypothetical protein